MDGITNESNKENNEKLPFISAHLYRILITGDSGSGKTSTLLNLIKERDDRGKTFLHSKDLTEP